MDTVRHFARSIGCAAATFVLLAISMRSPVLAAEYSEDAVKAAYLYRFAGYIHWRAPATDTPFTIDVLGDPGIARELRRLLPGHPINGQVAQVREITGIRDVGNAQIVYVAAGHADLLRTWVPKSSGAPMLLVTDEEGGLSNGSIFNFLTIDHNVRFEVSLSAAERWGLKISSDLLGVAIRVQGREGQTFLGCGPTSGVQATEGRCAPRVASQGTVARQWGAKRTGRSS